jgi:hypothetical protein
MTKVQRAQLFKLVATTNMEAVVNELSAIASWQNISTTCAEDAKSWRKVELSLDKLAQNMPFHLRSTKLLEDYKS